MCRLAAYIGPEIRLEQLLLKPPHNLVEQSWAPREMKEGRLNADGYGFGWFAPDGRAALYTSPAPIWSDHNLPHLGRALSAGQWLAMVRSATRLMANHPANTQPYTDGEFLFLHNGYINRFYLSMRDRVCRFLRPEIVETVSGNTDSEYLFAVLRQILADDPDMPVDEAFVNLFNLLEDWLGETKALLNFIVGDGQRLYATRHALNGECPSLYFTTDDEDFPDGMLIASEPLTESSLWQAVPDHHLLILDPDEPPSLQPL